MISESNHYQTHRVVFIYRFNGMMYTKSASVSVRNGNTLRTTIPRRLIELADVVYVEDENTTLKTRSYDSRTDHMRVDELLQWVERAFTREASML